MSRAAVAKSRADKAGKTASAPTPAVTHEIVPGKCNDQDWNLMLDHDDADDMVLDLVEEVVELAMTLIYRNYLSRQLVPYTVVKAKDDLLHIIEWQFLSCDNGEANLTVDNGWMEDDEAQPARTDCWAQGSVPKHLVLPVVPPELPLIEEQLTGRPEENVVITPPNSEEVCTTSTSTSSARPDSASMESEASIESPKKAKEQLEVQKRKAKFRPTRNKLKTLSTGKMEDRIAAQKMQQWLTEVPPDEDRLSPDTPYLQMPASCQSIVKLQNGRPPGNRDVVYDETGNIVKITKINPQRIPSHRVRTGFKVVDPAVEAAEARLRAMNTGRQKLTATKKTKNVTKIITISAPTGTRKRSSIKVPPGPPPVGWVRDGITPLPPPMVEVMEVSPGVVVKEGERVKHGPVRHIQPMEITATLRPVRGLAGLPTVLVSELIGHSPPIIKPLGMSHPIPPISPLIPHAPHAPSQPVN